MLTRYGIARGRKLQLIFDYSSLAGNQDNKEAHVQRRAPEPNILALAAGIGATEIYVNKPGTETVWIDAIGEPASRSMPDGAAAGRTFISVLPNPPTMQSSPDGRLVPLATPSVKPFPGSQSGPRGKTVVSGTDAWRSRRENLHALFHDPRFVLIDLQTLEDGTLAVWFDDGSFLPVYRAELDALLKFVGWIGEDVLFLGRARPDSATQRAQLEELATLIAPARLHVAKPGLAITATTPGATTRGGQVGTVMATAGLATTGQPVNDGLRIIEPASPQPPATPAVETPNWLSTQNGLCSCARTSRR